MNALAGPTFIFMWFGFLLLVTTAIALLLIWAVRSGQFRDQDRARSLPLDAVIPPGNGGETVTGKEEKARGVGP